MSNSTQFLILSAVWAVFALVEFKKDNLHRVAYGRYRGIFISTAFWAACSALGLVLAWWQA